jgi:tRNA (guanine-N7-)-methyltransferase
MVDRGSLAGIHIFYPDPWPKKRHNKRRLVREGLAELLASRLRPGGYLYFVTDVEDYGMWALDVLEGTPGLRNRYAGFAPRQDWRPETKFEARASRDGRGAWELFFVRD